MSEVFYEDGDLKTISDYCNRDVQVTAQLLLKLKQQETVASEYIHFIED